MRVLSYNIRHGWGADGSIDLPRTAAVIRDLAPDLVALQEVDCRTARSDGIDQIRWLAGQTGLQGYFMATIPLAGGQYGVGVLSRFPVERVHRRRLPGTEPRGVLVVEFGGDHPFLFGSTHFDLDEEARRQTIPILHDWCKTLPELPFLLCGDFNSLPDDAILKAMEGYWTAAGSAAYGPTYPADKPEVVIDYMMYRPAESWRIARIEVVNEPVASDHRPLLGEFEIIG